TTMVMLTTGQGVATIRWAGDSRASLIPNGRPELLTRDHSLVQELVEAGLVTLDKAATHPKANVITRALGTSAHVTVEALSLALEANDRVLLCSDGLSRSLEDRDVAERCDIEPLAERLLQNGLQRAASVNTSLVIVEAAAGAAPLRKFLLGNPPRLTPAADRSGEYRPGSVPSPQSHRGRVRRAGPSGRRRPWRRRSRR